MDIFFNLEYLFLTAYALCMVLFLVYSLGQLHLLWISHRSQKSKIKLEEYPAGHLPYVTIQLPVYNEQYVIKRVLITVANLDYPTDRFEIQLLDDSTDDTTRIAAICIEQLRQQGISVDHIRRPDRSGFKAGALAHGLTSARGELIAVFDADFMPEPDFLRKTVEHFKDEAVAAVQVRWEHLNEKASLLTQIEAFMLSLHFGFEQPRRWSTGLFMNFNGTCGVWRRAAISAAGGWSGRTITEDIDLSYRAQLLGWKLIYLNDYTCSGELPEEMSGLRTQQYRWLKGGAENARIHLRPVLNASLPRHVRWHAAQHLLAGSVYLLILSALFFSVPLAALKNMAITYDYVDFGIPFITSTIALLAVFYAAQRSAWKGNILAQIPRFLMMMVLFLIFTMGMSVHNGSAVLSGWLGRKSAFIRTPKYGGQRWASNQYVRNSFNPIILHDIVVMLFLLSGLYIGWLRGQFAFFPLQMMATIGLMWVTTLSLLHPIRASRGHQTNLEKLTLQESVRFHQLKPDRR